MIHPGWILEALGWQAIGVGMAAKKGIDAYNAGRLTAQQKRYLAPMIEWWNKYGVSIQESKSMLERYESSDPSVTGPVQSFLRSRIVPDSYMTRGLYDVGGRGHQGAIYAIILYYASKGRAAQFYGAQSDIYPMGFFFHSGNMELQDLIRQFMTEQGVPDLHWFLTGIEERKRYLDAAARR